MLHENVGLYIPREKLNTGNLEVALNFFLAELAMDGFHFEVGLFEEDGTVNFGIILRNTLHVRESILKAFSMLTKHKDVRVVKESGTPSFNRTPFSDWATWKDYNTVSDDLRMDDE